MPAPNIFIRSAGIGLVAAIAGFFVLQIQQKKVILYDADLTIDIRPLDNGSSGSTIKQVLEKRLQVSGYKYAVRFVTAQTLKATVKNITDTSSIKEILTGNGRIQFREACEPMLIASSIAKADEILRQKHMPTPSEIKVKPRRDSISKEVSDLLDSIEKNGEEGSKMEENNILELFQNGYSLSGIARLHVKDTAEVRSVLESPEVKNLGPNDINYYFGKDPFSNRSDDLFILYAIRTNGSSMASIENDDILMAIAEVDTDGKAMVSLEFSEYGTTKWTHLTAKNIGKPILIIFEDLVISAPVVQSEISGGKTILSGQFTLAQTTLMASMFRSDALHSDLFVTSSVIKPNNKSFPVKILLFSVLILLVFSGISYFIFKTLKTT